MLIAAIGLLVALDVKHKASLGGGALLTVNVVVYAINAYFALIGTQFAQRFIKRLQRRLDTSIDIFSPHLDLAKHLGRRVWAETISIILLAAPAYQMDKEVRPVFSVLERTASERSQGADHHEGLSPTLLGFRGSVAERLIECIKILRSIGIEAYVQELASDDNEGLVKVRARVFRDLTGPDVYYRPGNLSMVPSCVTSFFGRLDVVPFPFVALLRYDQSPSIVFRITSKVELAGLIDQNEEPDVISAKKVRRALRALEGATVLAPFSRIQLVGSRFLTKTQVVSRFRNGKITIRRNNDMTWEGYNYSSGFEASIQYEDGEGIDGNGQIVYGQKAKVSLCELGLTPQFALSQGMAKLFLHNRRLIAARSDRVNADLRNHRRLFCEDAQLKIKTLSYGFLIDILGTSSLTKLDVANWTQKKEFNPSIKSMVARWNASFTYVEERMNHLSSNPIRAWWYLLWDDIWRRNHRYIEPLDSRPESFSPFYRTSICVSLLT
ncbi:BQ2448_253 [Microbotryum intermedium]|uniref:BQ2448_253 protein n=1 Tax=Microbotryum intermedium TaxID=269621 RepID=A0A238F1Y2_9BASI|nr:BQ2448_253 [Microbotryum intermedium]